MAMLPYRTPAHQCLAGATDKFIKKSDENTAGILGRFDRVPFERLKAHALDVAQDFGRPNEYVNNKRLRQERPGARNRGYRR